jgi:DNA-binding MarR family transcriptional regulator
MVENDLREKHASTAEWVRFSEQLATVSRMVREGLARRLEAYALGWAQFSLLWVCREGPTEGIGQNELSTLLGVSSAHISALVEQLRSKDLIVGRRATSDRRRQLWRLTDTGHALIEVVLADLSGWADELNRRLGADDARFLDGIVQRLNAPDPADAVLIASKKGAA